jgi:hypothetical protein
MVVIDYLFTLYAWFYRFIIFFSQSTLPVALIHADDSIGSIENTWREADSSWVSVKPGVHPRFILRRET